MDRKKLTRIKFQGTPKSLKEAVILAACTVVGRNYADDFAYIIKDFLANKFQVAMVEHPECGDVIKELFNLCTEEKIRVQR